MQTPKASKNATKEVPRKLSPRADSSEVAQKICPRIVRKFNHTTGSESSFASSSSLSQSSRTPKKTSPRVSTERQSPKSPVPKMEKRRVSKVAELESQISQLQEAINDVKNQINSSNASKNQAEQETAASKKQLLAVFEKLKNSKPKERSEAESANAELISLKERLEETIFFVEDLKKRIKHCKESKDKANALADKTMMQLEIVKMTVDTLTIDGSKAVEAYDELAFELDQSRAHIDLLEEVNSVKDEIGRLSLALESAEMRCQEEEIRRTVEIGCVYEFVDMIKSRWREREAEIEVEIDKLKAESQLARSKERENELKKNKDEIGSLEASLMEKETEFCDALDKNVTLKLEMKRFVGADDVALTDVAMQARVKEQLEVVNAANMETEAELRRLRVQLGQWRKAAEAAAAMIPVGNSNGKFVGRTGSMDSHYGSIKGKIGSPYLDEMEGDFGKKKNGNVIERIRVLWKKQQK